MGTRGLFQNEIADFQNLISHIFFRNAHLRPNYKIWDATQIGLVPLKVVFNVWRFKSALNWNRFFADLRRGLNLLNSDSDLLKILRCNRNNIFPHVCFSTHLILSKNSFADFFMRWPIKIKNSKISNNFVKNEITKIKWSIICKISLHTFIWLTLLASCEFSWSEKFCALF